jgi:predicted membrane chloride channel (bestrophin family)
MAIFFFGIEELAVQLEEPFSILPLYTLCDTVWDGAVELYSSPTPLTRCVATSSDSVPVVELADHRVR